MQNKGENNSYRPTAINDNLQKEVIQRAININIPFDHAHMFYLFSTHISVFYPLSMGMCILTFEHGHVGLPFQHGHESLIF